MVKFAQVQRRQVIATVRTRLSPRGFCHVSEKLNALPPLLLVAGGPDSPGLRTPFSVEKLRSCLKQMATPSRSEQKKNRQWSFSRFITPSAAKFVLSRAQISARAAATKQVPCRSKSSTTYGKSTRYDNIRHETWLFWL
ncbi:hypothetical protein MTO96_015402 [Rhipicephalus appendiculatus]